LRSRGNVFETRNQCFFLKRTEQQRANGGLCENCNKPFHNTCLFLPKKTTISYCWECYDDQYFQKIETSITFKKIWEENRQQKQTSRKTPRRRNMESWINEVLKNELGSNKSWKDFERWNKKLKHGPDKP